MKSSPTAHAILPRTHELDVAFFLSFCIEQYKAMHVMDGRKAMECLRSAGVLDYLSEHYEILHTQNMHWILEEMEEMVREHEAK